ncbi:patatin [Hyphomicrobium nitrativorans NL23]|uniref:Patatin n=1 Tax=Hyphomicrobium nitrativorans NL23 TaxID=1029756 RepID=V5SC80_9HYPH|nr:patatin-like phospholipase family protein [Hyphomicrobium nitrativorans]AHB48092.1 patatin [Hyphomicrobium nitrativorans NL23]
MADPGPSGIAAKRGRSSGPSAAGQGPRIGLVLGGGGARGLAHILMLEVFDEFGIKPAVIAGSSIGAIFGAAYAAGLSGCEIREATEEALGNRFELIRSLFTARAARAINSRNPFTSRAAFLAPGGLLDVLLPPRVPDTFEALEIPLRIVASDFYALESVVLSSGPLRPAVAASMALPVIFEPVLMDGRSLVDGGLTNPLPFDILVGEADVLVAIDVSGTTVPSPKRARPTAIEALFSSSFLFERSIVREKLKSHRPDIYIDAGTGRYQALEFLKMREIFAAAQPAQDALRERLSLLLDTNAGAQVIGKT